MAIVNVRIPDDLKTRMSSLPELNWSEIVREAIENKIASERRKAKDREKIRAASGQNSRDIVAAIFGKLEGNGGH